jgi:hypothetical protein
MLGKMLAIVLSANGTREQISKGFVEFFCTFLIGIGGIL